MIIPLNPYDISINSPILGEFPHESHRSSKKIAQARLSSAHGTDVLRRENRKSYGKSPFLMAKSTISMATFNSFVYVYQRVPRLGSPKS